MKPCPRCHRHHRPTDPACPFCGLSAGVPCSVHDCGGSPSSAPAYGPPPSILPAYGPPPAAAGLPPVWEARGYGWAPASQSSLKQRVSLEDFQRRWRESAGVRDGWGSPSDFAQFEAKMAPGDEIWVYDTLGEVPLSGMRGLVLLRGGKVQASIVFVVS
jgi:hypothetical protein